MKIFLNYPSITLIYSYTFIHVFYVFIKYGTHKIYFSLQYIIK